MKKEFRIAITTSIILIGAVLSFSTTSSRAFAHENLVQVHDVAFGDTLDTLAIRYNVSLTQFAQVNRIINPKLIFAGQTLTVPDRALQIRDFAVVPDDGSVLSAAVRSGESLAGMAIANGRHNLFLAASGQTIALVSAETGMEANGSHELSALIHPIPLEQGHTGGIQVSAPRAVAVEITFNDKVIQLIAQNEVFVGVVGVDRWAVPGIYPITIQLEHEDGSFLRVERRVLVTAGVFQSEDIRLTSEVAEALNDGQSVAEENAYIAQIMSGYTPEIYWRNLFQLPAAGVLTSTFGTTRLYNESASVNLFHSGNDLAAKTGTAIIAPADGIVVDIGELSIRGLITIIDHGAGVYTGYWHQSAILVNEGEAVSAGQQIGAIGNSGLSTASHLHWEMWVGGVQVDSLQWVRQSFP